jgi:hypothetical protein
LIGLEITDAYVLNLTTTGNGTLNGPLLAVVKTNLVLTWLLLVLPLFHQPGLVTPTLMTLPDPLMILMLLVMMTLLVMMMLLTHHLVMMELEEDSRQMMMLITLVPLMETPTPMAPTQMLITMLLVMRIPLLMLLLHLLVTEYQ